ncbi:MAG: hypothetical protein ACE5EU_16765, partial [Paracoccaceae bacterium]
VVADFLRAGPHADRLSDATEVIARLRMIKGPEEIAMIRQAGRVAVAIGGKPQGAPACAPLAPPRGAPERTPGAASPALPLTLNPD